MRDTIIDFLTERGIKVDLTKYDVILINTSGGKDSHAMMDVMFWKCLKAGVHNRMVAAHADLGKIEWEGTRELAELHSRVYGMRFEVVTYKGSSKGIGHKDTKVKTLLGPGSTLLDYAKAKGAWPDNESRWCTSDFKRGPISTIITKLVNEVRAKKGKNYRVKVLNCLGLRAEESPARAKKEMFEAASGKDLNNRKEIDTYLPILDLKVGEVWDIIHASGVEYHRAYDLGMPRLSCMFCVFAPMSALIIAGKENPKLLDEYIEAEAEMGHTFRKGFSIAEVKEAIAAEARGEAIKVSKELESWVM